MRHACVYYIQAFFRAQSLPFFVTIRFLIRCNLLEPPAFFLCSPGPCPLPRVQRQGQGRGRRKIHVPEVPVSEVRKA